MNDTIGKLRMSLNELMAHKDSFIYIVEANKDFNYWTLLPYIVSIASLIIVIYDRGVKPKIFGKILSFTATKNQTLNYRGRGGVTEKTLNGLGYMIKISLGVYRKDLSFSDANIFVKYKTGNRLKGEIYWTKNEVLKIGNERFKLVIPQDQFLTYNNFIEKNKVLFFYVKFIVPNKLNDELVENIDIEFVLPNKKTRKVTLEFIDEKQMFFDEEIHIKQED